MNYSPYQLGAHNAGRLIISQSINENSVLAGMGPHKQKGGETSFRCQHPTLRKQGENESKRMKIILRN